MPQGEREAYESKATALHAQYQTDYQSILERSSQLQAQKKLILEKGDYATRTWTKRISPYRVYKRETAASIKAEFPLMSNEERSQIVKQRWHFISDRAKAIYVALARLEEEQARWDAIQNFYKERI